MYDKYSARRLVITAGVMLATGLLRLLLRFQYVHSASSVIFVIYLLVCAEWMYSIRRRFLQKELKRYMTSFSLLLLLLLSLTVIRYQFIPAQTFWARQLWYWYYVPMMLMPVLMFLSTLYIGKSDRYTVSPKWNWIFIPYLIVMAGIVTNDKHQLAFRLDTADGRWNGEYTYGVLYYMAAGLLALSVLAVLIVIFNAGLKRRFIRHIWLPVLVIAFGFIYWIVYVLQPGKVYGWLSVMFTMPEAVCVFSVCLWESLVSAHLIPSNSNHKDFFAASSLQAGLTDKNYTVRLASPHSVMPQPEQVQQAETAPVPLGAGTTLLKSYQVTGGDFYWTEDMSEIIRLNERLADTEDYLTEENAMLDAATAIEEGRKTFTEQNRLYDKIEKQIKPQLDKVNELIETLPEEEEAFLQQMKQAGILNAYIKRYSNLLLLAGSNDRLDMTELALAVSESLSYVRLADITADFIRQGDGTVPSALALLLFEVYEQMLEAALPDLSAVMVSLQATDGNLTFYIETAGAAKPVPLKAFESRAADLSAVINYEAEDGVACVTVHAPTGGERK